MINVPGNIPKQSEVQESAENRSSMYIDIRQVSNQHLLGYFPNFYMTEL